jgi:hypothetical protein
MMKKVMSAALLIASTHFAYAVDTTQDFLTAPNFPLVQPLPVRHGATVGNGLAVTPGTTQAFSLLMGSRVTDANITSGQQIRDIFFMNYLVGNLNNAIGCPIDTGQGCGSSPFYAVARHYSPGDRNDLHVIRPGGLALRAICSSNHTNCTPGNIYGGMIRVPYEFRPGMIIKVRYRSPTAPHSWAPIWLFSGSQTSPGPSGNPYQGFGTTQSLVQLPKGEAEFEIDMNDNFPVWNVNSEITAGYQLIFGTPNNYGVKWIEAAPHVVYRANAQGYQAWQNTSPNFETLPTPDSIGFHSLVLSWASDGSNLMYEFMDGKLLTTAYMEYSQAPWYQDASGNWKQQGMHLIIGNQAVPNWLVKSGEAIRENDSMPDGWTIVVQEISAWNGTVEDPTRYAP